MKNKFIILTLCFTIIFTNINLNNYKSYANNSVSPLVVDGGVISAPMLATVASLAVGTGIVIKNSDDVYDIGRIFYDYVKSHNSLTWDFVQSAFAAGVTLVNDVVHVDNNFLDIIKGFFEDTFSDISDKNIGSVSSFSIPSSYRTNINVTDSFKYIYFDSFKFYVYKNPSDNSLTMQFKDINQSKIINLYGTSLSWGGVGSLYKPYINFRGWDFISNGIKFYFEDSSKKIHTVKKTFSNTVSDLATFPYTGGYTWDNVESKKENESVALPVPGNLGQLVGQGSTDFWDNTDVLVGGGSITVPGVSNPSIDVTDDVFVGAPSTDVPGVGNPSVPNDSIWSTIKDFVVSLVVPSDTFWTDTFNGFRDNFSKNFPMLDMSKFDSLAVGGKPFPNLYAYGSKIVDGDVINSIVDWLRPIVAGFIMICLMFFNYRKIYKLIRNTEPFGGIAQGTSDFRTGLSAPPINNGLDSNPMGNLRDTLFDMRNDILRRENEK